MLDYISDVMDDAKILGRIRQKQVTQYCFAVWKSVRSIGKIRQKLKGLGVHMPKDPPTPMLVQAMQI